MAKSTYALLEEFKKDLESGSLEKISAFIQDLDTQNKSIKDLCERTRGTKSEKLLRFESIKTAIISYLIFLIHQSDFKTKKRWKSLVNKDFLGDSHFYKNLIKISEWITSLEKTLNSPAQAFTKFLIERIPLPERKPFQKALLEFIGPEKWVEVQAEIIATLAQEKISDELTLIKQNNLLESFLCFVVRKIEDQSLAAFTRREYVQIIKWIIDRPTLQKPLEPFFILFYAYGLFDADYFSSIKEIIEVTVFGDNREVLVKEVERFKKSQENLRKTLIKLKENFEDKKWKYIAEHDLESEHGRQLKLFESKTIRFYEKWKDEEIVKILDRLIDPYLLTDEIIEYNFQDGMKKAEKNHLIDKAHSIRDQISEIFKAYNAEVIGKSGEALQYNPLIHKNYASDLQKGDKAKIIIPGLIIRNDKGAVKYIIRKALVA